jgi:hypothetical protein
MSVSGRKGINKIAAPVWKHQSVGLKRIVP